MLLGPWTNYAMTDYHVIIPKEDHQIIEFRQDGLLGIGVINKALCDFKPRVVFAWHLSLMIQFESLADNGMPSKGEQEVIDPFGNSLDSVFKGDDPDKPNALFLARITWNSTRELIYRVYEPEPPHQYLARLIHEKTSPREFDYRIDNDPDWKLAEWHLKATKAEPTAARHDDSAMPRASSRVTEGPPSVS